MPRSWKPEVLVNNTEKWCGNALRFATETEALENARDLSCRWLVVRDFRASESDDPVNYAWVDGRLDSVPRRES